MIFSVLSLYSLKHYLSNTAQQEFDKQYTTLYFVEFALIKAVKDIEYYNLLNGHYPDSISQIRYFEGSYTNIDEYAKSDICSYEFYYHLHKDKNTYILSSVGEDQTLFTNDDLFPDIDLTNTDNLGLLKSYDPEYEYPDNYCNPLL